MSIPYESNATSWASIRVIDYWDEYPFSTGGLPNITKQYKYKCHCKLSEYESPLFTDQMISASAAKVFDLPVINANAYFLGDDNFAPADGGCITFVRTFGEIPTSWSETKTINYTFPEYREWAVRYESNQTYERFALLENQASAPTPPKVLRPALNETVTAFISYDYFYSTNYGASVSLNTIYSNSQPQGPGKITAAITGVGTYTYYIFCPPLTKVNYVCDSELTYADTGANTWPATSESLTAYKGKVTSKTQITIDCLVTQYGGNIYERKTTKVVAR